MSAGEKRLFVFCELLHPMKDDAVNWFINVGVLPPPGLVERLVIPLLTKGDARAKCRGVRNNLGAWTVWPKPGPGYDAESVRELTARFGPEKRWDDALIWIAT